MTTTAQAYGAASPSSKLAPLQIARRAPGPTDVQMEILYCGVCHSDVHTARGEWPGTNYACVPGHEIVGRVTAVGAKVTKLKVGDIGATGCLVDSCRTCPSCQKGLEQFCLTGATFTYNSPDKHLGGHTLGGYSTGIVVDEAFTLRVPKGMDLAATAPLLCAGITTYSPLRHLKVGPGQKVGIVGVPEQPLAVHAFSVIMPRRNFSGSCIGGIAETQEMLEFCAKHGIVSDIELIPIQKINEAWERMINQDVRYRFVIDMASIKQA